MIPVIDNIFIFFLNNLTFTSALIILSFPYFTFGLPSFLPLVNVNGYDHLEVKKCYISIEKVNQSAQDIEKDCHIK